METFHTQRLPKVCRKLSLDIASIIGSGINGNLWSQKEYKIPSLGRIASIIGSGINGNSSPSQFAISMSSGSLLLLEVELMETSPSRMSANKKVGSLLLLEVELMET